jgi:hypothetical protein
MSTSNNFNEYYKKISDTELLTILDNPKDYQPMALEAAKKEFASRQLTDTEIQEARHLLLAKQAQKEKEKERIKAVETRITNAGHTFIDTINPIQSGIPSTEKTIRLIVIVFGGIFLYQFIKDFRIHVAFVKDIPGNPFESSLYLLPLILLPVAIFTFWKRKKLGWILLTIFLTFSAVGAMWSLFQSFNWKPSGLPVWDNLFPRPSPATYIIQLLFLVGTVLVLCKKNIREVFSVEKQRVGITIGVTGIVTFILILMIS